ncbi:MAG: DUF3194 domain-containing protein [Candidatus Lokiarchaeia archaeon]
MNYEKKTNLKNFTIEDIEELCILAEREIRKYIHSKCPEKEINQLEITVEIGFEKTTNLTIEVDLESDSLSTEESKMLVEEAVRKAINIIDEKLLGLSH